MPRTAVVLSLPLLLLAACSGGGGGDGGPQSSPQALTLAVYADVHAGEFAKACALVLPAAMARFTAAGTDCQSSLAGKNDPTVRASYKNVKVDAKAIQVNGDTAVVPQAAVTFSGVPSSDGDTKLARQNGKWYLAG